MIMDSTSSASGRRWYQLRFGNRFWTLAGAVLLLAAGAYGAVRWHVESSLAADAPEHRSNAAQVSTAERERLSEGARRILPLQVAKRIPDKNDWLARHGTKGQTFDEYLATNPNRPNEIRTTLYVANVGQMTAAQQRVVDKTRELLGIFFGVQALSLSDIPLDTVPADYRRVRSESRSDDQILTNYILEDILAPRRPKNAVAVLGLTAVDLYPGDEWNYVFGQASFDARVGIHSFHRYGDPDAGPAEFQVCLLRTLKVALHESGHMFGLEHCRVYECGMNGSNHTEELDGNALGFCVDCEQKLWWACHLPIFERYQKLREFAERNDLVEAERIWRAHVRACEH
ncbi:MAG TPA: archaemetzincin [Pirellulales bacterium]|nr:archaemetzincin [Pirellulales bacterium]